MSGFSISLARRRRCEASGKSYRRYLRFGLPDAHGGLNCPVCGKRVFLRGDETGEHVVIPRHLERIVGL